MQATNFITATEVIGSIVYLESLKDIKEAFDNEFLVQRKLDSLNQLRAEIERLKKKERLLNISENEECILMITPAAIRVEHLMFLWSTVADWIRNKDQWMQQRFQRLNVEHMFVMVNFCQERSQGIQTFLFLRHLGKMGLVDANKPPGSCSILMINGDSNL